MLEPSTSEPSGSKRRPMPLASIDTDSRNALEHARDVVRLTALETAEVLSGAAKALLTPSGMAGAAVELAWAGTHLALYPFGLFGGPDGHEGQGYSVEGLPPMQRGLVIGDVEAAGTPILLVHGIGHSLGGLIARYYVTRLGGHERVHTLVTLGTPHGGTFNAYALPSSLCRQLRPGSALMRELSAAVPDCGTRFVAYWSDLDQMVFPQRNAMLNHPDLTVHNIEIHATGHMSLPINGDVVHGISTTLAQLGTDGRLLAAGVTELKPHG